MGFEYNLMETIRCDGEIEDASNLVQVVNAVLTLIADHGAAGTLNVDQIVADHRRHVVKSQDTKPAPTPTIGTNGTEHVSVTA